MDISKDVSYEVKKGDLVVIYYKSGSFVMGEVCEITYQYVELLRDTILFRDGRKDINPCDVGAVRVLKEIISHIKFIEDDPALRAFYYSYKWI